MNRPQLRKYQHSIAASLEFAVMLRITVDASLPLMADGPDKIDSVTAGISQIFTIVSSPVLEKEIYRRSWSSNLVRVLFSSDSVHP